MLVTRFNSIWPLTPIECRTISKKPHCFKEKGAPPALGVTEEAKGSPGGVEVNFNLDDYAANVNRSTRLCNVSELVKSSLAAEAESWEQLALI